MHVVLVMFKADGTRRDFPLKGVAMTIGRKNTCDLRIPLTSVSRQHCRVCLDEQGVVVEDLGSSNGTFVNDERVQRQALDPGDAILVGPVVFTVVINGEPEHVKPVRTLLATHRPDPNDSPAMGLDAVDHPPSTADSGATAGLDAPTEQDPIDALGALADEADDIDFSEVELAEIDDDELK
ncbi:MAG: FHA domain-containing protein [Planctomycetota bacterium]